MKKSDFEFKVVFSMSPTRFLAVSSRPACRLTIVAALVLAVFPLLAFGQKAQQLSPRQLFERAHQAQLQGKLALAAREYRKLLKSHPEIVPARANLAAALVSLGRLDEAIAAYQTALKQLPGDPRLELSLALAYYKKKDFADAARLLGTLHRSHPDDVRVAILLGGCYVRTGRSKQAIAVLEPLEKNNSDNLELDWALGSAMIASGNQQKGLELVQKVAERGNDAGAYLLAAETSLKLAKFNQARDDLAAARRLDPTLPGLNFAGGMVMEYLGGLQQAVKLYEKAIAHNPDNFEAQLHLGTVLYTQRKLEPARRHLDAALKLRPVSVLATYEMGRVDLAEGQLQPALKKFQLAEQELPEWLAPHIQLAALYYRLKQPREGERERKIVNQITAEQRRRESKSRIVRQSIPSH